MKYKNIFILFFLFLISIVLAETSKIEKAIELINSCKYDEAIGILKENNGKSSILLSMAYLEKKDFINSKKFALESLSQ
jgi:hypothetical protein